MTRLHWLALIAAVAMVCRAAPAAGPLELPVLPAFPGAEGFGAVAQGGRGCPVYYVTNLDDDGPGSFRDAVSQGQRMVLFKVSGTIALKTGVVVRGPNVTIAGETAPGAGICFRGSQVVIKGDEVILRFLRFRPGDELKTEHDALSISAAKCVIVDHCALSWSTDSLNDVVHLAGRVTVQWCILSEPLNRSVHAKGTHGFATGWGSGTGDDGASYHHNLIAHAASRSPRIGGFNETLADVRNNVIYNLGEGWAYCGEPARINYVANFFVPGPDTRHPDKIFRVNNPRTWIYLRDNYVEGAPAVNESNGAGIQLDDGVALEAVQANLEFPVVPVATQRARDAYQQVLEKAGCTLPWRDAVDERIVESVRNRTGHVIDSPGEVGGWPELKSVDAKQDSDGDGLPDSWERKHGLDPKNPEDGAGWAPLVAGQAAQEQEDVLPPRGQTFARIHRKAKRYSGYTNLEMYLHELVDEAR